MTAPEQGLPLRFEFRLLLCMLAAAAALSATAGAQASGLRPETPRLAEIARGPAFIPDSIVPGGARRPAATCTPGFTAGQFTVSDGQTVSMCLATAFAADPTTGQRWADFLASLVHGSELSLLTMYVMTPGQVGRKCGFGAFACYGGDRLYAPGQDPTSDVSAEAVVTHEYGHHVAFNRKNPPWQAIARGPKRWASYENVCERSRKRQLYPGAEDPDHYQYNPGEGFAESYRVLNERLAGLPEAPWSIVTNLLYPDDAALAAIQEDVTSPWAKATTQTVKGALTAKVTSRSYVLGTPLDGTMTLRLLAPRSGRFSLVLYAGGSRVAHRTGRGSLSLTRVVCGRRSYRARVDRLSGSGTFRLAYATP